ncbi:MAG: AlpA family phage regulatory protein, partial [Desulfuromonadales bacterium]
AKSRQDMLKRNDLFEITGLSPSTIARMESKGLFPARVQLSPKRVAWRRIEVEAWAEERRQAA